MPIRVSQKGMGDPEPIVVGNRTFEHQPGSDQRSTIRLDVVSDERHDEPRCPHRPVTHTDTEKA